MVSFIQVVVAIALVVLILLQERSSGLGGLLGASEVGGFYQARRGVERIIFAATIGCLVAFVGLSIVQLLA